MAQEKTSSLYRMHEEIRLTRTAEAITEYPNQLLRLVEEEISMHYRHAHECRRRIAVANRQHSDPGEAAAYELAHAVAEKNIIIALRVRGAYHHERLRLLERMAVDSCGQFEAFDGDTIEKLADREKLQLKRLCEVEHRRREKHAWKVASERNGKFTAVADVVFEKDCLLEDPWTDAPRDEDEALSSPWSASPPEKPRVKLFTAGRVCRLPLHKAEQLCARRLVRLLRTVDCGWIPRSHAF
ncbi:hypothetical protein TGPRC2_206700 [Toxoplasma gondii TgCatPRC2]|uniref:Uncharacterized protein n=14 Tax=Toxoplasma gondii TaxID=5811 RepID=B9PZW2_TOXGV|nr:hypothetical protein TGME49_206700 [Toxoplasma gondii ME49]EPR61366.1 hypothetical protein TGGT1_206700 [Toxoplasma gondii GT1]ESS33302.1 hypothetical protein TGVEG_206700 [Toxoplasma gondii VEG]KAF4642606.1 hypothetical protein TGRH88_033310 [Toxoplasma gondii]KFG32198.1 hypothetical protein TGDOM2_206700 [Toxoplasma gondii GAB2-2007-GAL-DOM2]KFG33959.1 hypothetical protein TGP89_206700 [Toxoplasma gondii p89]KFG38346.1 hypothetical protein TGFOU_206700 [Toxoplasma gondii FOU]KFG59039.1 |eukprot:XP_002367851.1 hypothetical protein TGME49_206700 [Toxoplasma gondii ME49]